MTVCCVIVTYGNRSELLARVIEALLKEKVEKIVIVNNGSAPSSRLRLQALADTHFSQITIHDFKENKGSAPGFHKGLELASRSGCEFIWLMDDDNKPAPGALDILKKFWNNHITGEKKPVSALSSWRKSRPNFRAAIEKNNPDLILQTKNNFAGFHIKTIFSKMQERLMKPAAKPPSGSGFLKIKATCYGGLFFHKSLLNEVGFPDDSYVLYADDFAYTFGISQKGGDIWLVTNSIVEDMESSFYLPEKKKLLYHSVFDGGSDTTIYYSFRNSIYFSDKYLLNDRTVRGVNKLLFLSIITLIGLLRGKMHRLNTLREAIRDAEDQKLGENPKYKLS